ncbi:LOW QUALITY PROTEIN: hypothetical protein B0H65DRAFT_560199 [Neurospora tetraspora]|uniref:NWD NACHT-NTPase N-terminal domain-containing protein n=1 Tax=Neurospora tetraspora TaxID=94610 RepID=A0AAE0J874_9PEZI|nr:LOW QUALITY PROTEIN: hypothetical protein B0H65DRAFT_560199 [Neurospora tetraspora]
MGLFHRSRDKDSPQAVPKHRFGFRKSFKKLTGAKSTSLAPEPLVASVLRQSNASKPSPRTSIINDTSASLEGSAAASESITTIPPCRQVQEITSTPKTLWDRAYDALRSSNDPDKSGLVADYERKVLHELKSNVSGRTVELEETFADSLLDQKLTNKAVLDRAIEDALKHAAKGASSARSSIDKAGKLTLALQNFISEAVKAFPEASLVWAGVYLVLPLLTQPAIADEAQRNGFSYVTSRIGFWTTLERQLANTGNWTESVQEEFVRLYQHLLEFQVRIVLRYHQSGFERFVQDLSSNAWEQLITVIKHQEGLLYQDLQQYHNTNLSLTIETLKENSNKSLESNARFLEALQEVQDFVRKGAENKLQEKEEKCLHLFRLTDNQRHVTYEWYKSRVQKRVEGTCIWAVQHENFQNWLKLKSGPLLITADPGCGKSVLSKYLIDQYLPQRFPTATICYFFFKDGDQNTVKQALCALLHQLFCQKPELIKHALEEYAHAMIRTTSSLWRIFNDATHDERAVLDALDECEPNEFTLLVENINKVGESVAKFLLTSRPYGDYGDMLERFPRVLIPGEKEDQSDQISTEINLRVDQFYKLQDQLKNTLWAELNKTKHRTYLWVYLVFDYLKTLVSSDALKRTAQGFKTAIEKLPRTVEDAYERILNRPQGALRTILRRVLCRPLTLSEMQIVVNIEPDMISVKELDMEEEEDFSNRPRTICGLFRRVEFLQAETELSTAPGKNQAHGELARICVRDGPFLHVAVALGCNGLVRHILRNISAKEINTGHNERETTPLALAARYGNNHTIQLLIEAGAEVGTGWKDKTPLYEAVDARKLVSATTLLDYGASVDQLDARGRTLLHLTARNDDAKMVEVLVEKGINVNSTDNDGNTALLACRAVYDEMYRRTDGVKLARFVIERGACLDIANKDGTTALMQAVDSGRWALAKLLIAKGADPNLQDCKGELALHKVYYSDKDEDRAVSLARTLVEKCVHLEAQDHDGFTPLHAAVAREHVKLVRLLLEGGADLEATDHRGFTPLVSAVFMSKTKVLPSLLDSGANVEVTDNEGKGPLLFAVATSEPQIVKMLLNFGAKVECTGKGPSLLKKAVEVIEDNLNTANVILREYEMVKERTSGLETGTENWDLITADSPEMVARLGDACVAWDHERAKRSLATHQILRRAVADTGIDRLDEEVETVLDRAIKDVDRALEEMMRIQFANDRGDRRW